MFLYYHNKNTLEIILVSVTPRWQDFLTILLYFTYSLPHNDLFLSFSFNYHLFRNDSQNYAFSADFSLKHQIAIFNCLQDYCILPHLHLKTN